MAVFDFSVLGGPVGRLKSMLTNRSTSLAGTVIGHTASGERVIWPAANPKRAGHGLVLGASGSGKSVLVATTAIEQLQADRSMSLCVIDPKSDLVKYVLAGLAAQAPDRLADVVLVRPFRPLAPTRAAVPLNLCRLPRSARTPISVRALQIAGLVSRMSNSAVATKVGIGARQLDLLTNVLAAVLAIEDKQAHPLLALDALVIEDGLPLLGSLTSLREAGLALSSMKLSAELAASTGSRIRSAFGLTESIASMFCSTECLDWSRVLGPGKICLIDLGGPPGGQASLLSFFSGLFVTLVTDHLLSRQSPYEGHHCSIIIDEAQMAATALAGGTGETILSIGRSLRLSLTLMSQATAIIARQAPGLLEIVNANAPMKLVGRLAPKTPSSSRARWRPNRALPSRGRSCERDSLGLWPICLTGRSSNSPLAADGSFAAAMLMSTGG